MVTKLNAKLAEYFNKTAVDDISIESILKYFPDVQITNDYGGLLHGAVHEKFNEDKVLKFIRVLLENGIDPNVKGKNTGYNYIQLALYGYTTNSGDHSYSTEFIVHLIELGRMHGLDVQTFDHDQDSIVHTALASEVFTGDTVAILDALGSNFDLKCVDNHGHNIYEALLEYLKEAERSRNQSWLAHLTTCKEEIKRRVEIGQYDAKAVDLEICDLKKELLEASKQSSIDILKNYKRILELEARLKLLLDQKTQVTGTSEEEHFIPEINRSIESIMRVDLEEVRLHPNKKRLQELLGLAESFQFSSFSAELKDISTSYEEAIQKLKKSFEAADTLFELEELRKHISQFTEENVLVEFQKMLEELSHPFTDCIAEIESLLAISDTIDVAIDNTCWTRHDLKKLSLEELQAEKDSLTRRIQQMQAHLKHIIQERTREFVKEMLAYAQPNLFSKDEICDLLIETIGQEMKQEMKTNTSKVKRKTRANQ